MNKEQELQADKYYNELVKNKTITTLNEALVFKLAYEKALTMHDVGCSVFTTEDIGKEFTVKALNSEHGFYIGETVTLIELSNPDDDEYKFDGEKDYWYCGFAEVERK